MKKDELLALITKCIDTATNMNEFIAFDYNNEQINKFQKIGEKLQKEKDYVTKASLKDTTYDSKIKKYTEVYQIIQTELERQKSNYDALVINAVIKNTSTDEIINVLKQNKSLFENGELQMLENEKLLTNAFIIMKNVPIDELPKINENVYKQITTLKQMIIKCINKKAFDVQVKNVKPDEKENEAINKYLNTLISKLNIDKQNKQKVAKKKKANKKNNDKSRDLLKGVGIGLLAAAVIAGSALFLKQCSKDQNKNNDNNNLNNEPDKTVQTTENDNYDNLDINQIDITNAGSLYSYASRLSIELNKYNINLSTEDIEKAILLANHNYTDEAVFEDKAEAFDSMTNIGTIITKLSPKSIIHNGFQLDSKITEQDINDMINKVTDGSISLSSLNLNAENGNYQIYDVVYSLINIMNDSSKEDNIRVAANNLYNEIYVRHFKSATLTVDCNDGQEYALAGLFYVHKDINNLLYDGRSNVYGNATDQNGNLIQIDGTYGHDCLGALRSYLLYEKNDNGYRYNFGTWIYDHMESIVSQGKTK